MTVRALVHGWRRAAWSITTLLAAAGASAAAADQAAAPAPVAAAGTPLAAIPMSRQIDFTSSVNGHTYRIQVAMPFAPPPPQGYPVLYVLDGDGYFGTWSFAARMRALGSELEPAVVVGIGYPDAQASVATSLRRRLYDLTPSDADPQTRQKMAALAPGGAAEYAGADAFLRVIENEIKPRVAQVVPVDPERSLLFGHSLGGLFVLHALFTRPQAFSTYLALSPSIWWDDRVVLKGEAAFARQVSERKVAPRIFIAVGGSEQSVPVGPLPPGLTREELEKDVANAAMLDNAQGLASRLGALPGAPGYQVRMKVHEGESHLSVAWAAVNSFLEFALPPARTTPAAAAR